MATAVVSGRIDERVRQRADIVMRKAGLTPTEVIQNVWGAIAETGEIPACAQPKAPNGRKRKALAHLDSFLESLPPANPAYASMEDDDILALKVRDHA